MERQAMNSSGNIFTIDDLSAYLKIPKSTLYKLAQQGKIPGQKIGRHWRFSKDVIDQWLEQTQKHGSRPAGT
jgi:excisionase family DNA binding protein